MSGFQSKRTAAADKLQELPSEWAGIKAILDEYGLQAIDFVADFKASLAQPAQEPVAWMYQCTADNSWPVLLRHRTNWAESGSGLWTETPLYTTPPQREWVGLTAEDTFEIGERLGLADVAWLDLMKAIEAKLKERNS